MAKISLEDMLNGISNAKEKIDVVKRSAEGVIGNAAAKINEVKRSADTIMRTVEDVKRLSNFGVNVNKSANSWVCGCGVTNTTRFCGSCGNPAPTENRVVCPNCNWERPPENSDLKFCGNCGTQLEA